MKYINFKRVFLNIGMFLAAAALCFLAHQIYENSFLRAVNAVVTGSEMSDNTYIVHPDGERENLWDFYVVYTVNSEEYTDSVIGEEGEYPVGTEVKKHYDIRDCGSLAYPENNIFYIVVFGVPGAVIIFFCRSAFKGYKTEYLDRYRKTVIFSIVSGLIPAAQFIYSEFIFSGSGFMPGLEELVQYLLFFVLLAAVFVLNVIVWIISAALYAGKRRREEKEKNKEVIT